jgi:hypothetical protein
MNPFKQPIKGKPKPKPEKPQTFEGAASLSLISESNPRGLASKAGKDRLLIPNFWLFSKPYATPLPGAIFREEIDSLIQEQNNTIKILNSEVTKMRDQFPAKNSIHSKGLTEYLTFEIKNKSDLGDVTITLYDKILNKGKAVKINIEAGFVVDSNKALYPSSNTNLFEDKTLVDKRSKLKTMLNKINDPLFVSNGIEKLNLAGSTNTVIGLFRIRVEIFYTQIDIGGDVVIPEWVSNSKYYVSFANAKNNTCFWQCLALYLNPEANVRFLTQTAYELMNKFYKKKKSIKERNAYLGIIYPDELELIEQFFEVGINVYVENPEKPETTTDERLTKPLLTHRFATEELKNGEMDVLMIEQAHFCYIRPGNKQHILKSYKCDNCGFITDHRKTLESHRRGGSDTCLNVLEKDNVFPKEREVWEGSCAVNPILKALNSMSDRVVKNVIGYKQGDDFDQKFNDFCLIDDYIVFDFESCSQPTSSFEHDKSVNLKLLNNHIPTTFQIYSNTCGLQTGMLDECNNDPFLLVSKFVDTLVETGHKISLKNLDKYEKLLSFAEPGIVMTILSYITNTSVCGYNSSFYDINLIKSFGFIQKLRQISKFSYAACKTPEKELAQKAKEDKIQLESVKVVLAGKNYKSIEACGLKFLDIMHFAGPGVPLKKFLETYKIPQSKLVIDYSYSMKVENWVKPFPPPMNECRNTLKMEKSIFFNKSERSHNEGELMALSDYEIMVKEGVQRQCQTIRDYLMEYMKCDVEPFYQAIKCHFKLFTDAKALKDTGIYIPPTDCLKQCIGMPQLSAHFGNLFAKGEYNKFNDVDAKSLSSSLDPLDQEQCEKQIVTAIVDETSLRQKQTNDDKQDKKILPKSDFSCLSYEALNAKFEKQNKKCKYCCSFLDYKLFEIDRIDRNEGFIINNLILSCSLCKLERNNTPFSTFIEKKKLRRFTDKVPLVRTFKDSDDDIDCYFRQRKQVCGGLSLPVHRFHNAGKTYIKRAVLNPNKSGPNKLEYEEGDLVTGIISYDANSLYPYAYGGDVPCEFVKTEKNLSYEQFLTQIAEDKVFGFYTVDIEIDQKYWNEYSDYPPFFITTDIPNDPKIIGEVNYNARLKQSYSIEEKDGKYRVLISNDENNASVWFSSEEHAISCLENQAKQCEKQKDMTKTNRKLTSVFAAKNIMLASDLITWYISKFGVN